MKIPFHNHVLKPHNAVVRQRHLKSTQVLWHLPQKWSRDALWFLLIYLGFNYRCSLHNDMQAKLHPRWPIKHSQWIYIPRDCTGQSRIKRRHEFWMCFLPEPRTTWNHIGPLSIGHFFHTRLSCISCLLVNAATSNIWYEYLIRECCQPETPGSTEFCCV